MNHSMSMNDAIAVVKDLELRGIRLSVINDRFSVAPASLLTDDDRKTIQANQPVIMRVIKTRCTGCRRLRDAKGSCWKCFTRLCESCGQNTGSCFIANCLLCQAKIEKTELAGAVHDG